MLPLHIGMHVRFLQHLDLARGVVKDAEGTVVHGEIEPEDAGEVEIARRERRPTYLRHVPMGVWLRTAKYMGGGRRPSPGDPCKQQVHTAICTMQIALQGLLAF